VEQGLHSDLFLLNNDSTFLETPNMHDHDGDDELLSMLRQLSIDLAKPREVNFYFVFSNLQGAENGAEMLRSFQFEPEVYKIPVPWWKKFFAKPQWCITFSKQMVVSESNIKRLTTEFQKIAEASDGSYDGWEVNVMDDNIGEKQLNGLGL
jgi:hypothetical protein